MMWFTQDFGENSLVWFAITTLAAILSSFATSWLTYRFIKRREILEALELEGQGEKEERIRQEVVRWANPILAAVKGLESRFSNILDYAGYLVLSENYERRVDSGWSISYDYFMHSTLYLFGQYFAWILMLQESLNFELFESQKEKDEFFEAIQRVTSTLSSFPPDFGCTGKDAQVFSLQQRAIGELFLTDRRGGRWCSGSPELIERLPPQDTQAFALQQRATGELFLTNRGTNRWCIGYPEFLERLTDDRFSKHLKPLQMLLEDVSPESDCRWKRLESTRQALLDLDAQCRKLLVLPEDG